MNMDDPGSPFRRALSVAEVAALWGVPKSQVYQAVRDGRLAAFRLGKHLRIPQSAIDAVEAQAGDAA